jgi:hypothetical protein
LHLCCCNCVVVLLQQNCCCCLCVCKFLHCVLLCYVALLHNFVQCCYYSVVLCCFYATVQNLFCTVSQRCTLHAYIARWDLSQCCGKNQRCGLLGHVLQYSYAQNYTRTVFLYSSVCCPNFAKKPSVQEIGRLCFYTVSTKYYCMCIQCKLLVLLYVHTV